MPVSIHKALPFQREVDLVSLGSRSNRSNEQGLKPMRKATLKRAGIVQGNTLPTPAKAGCKEEPAKARLIPLPHVLVKFSIRFRNSPIDRPLLGAFLIPPALPVVRDLRVPWLNCFFKN